MAVEEVSPPVIAALGLSETYFHRNFPLRYLMLRPTKSKRSNKVRLTPHFGGIYPSHIIHLKLLITLPKRLKVRCLLCQC